MQKSMSEALTIPHFYYKDEFDMTNLVSLIENNSVFRVSCGIISLIISIHVLFIKLDVIHFHEKKFLKLLNFTTNKQRYLLISFLF